jgi:hypothetical protein
VDALPSLRVTEGDFHLLLSRLDKLDSRLDEMYEHSTNMAADILAIRRSAVDITSKRAADTAYVSAKIMGNSTAALSESVPIVAPTAPRIASEQHVVNSNSRSWADIVSSLTPVPSAIHASVSSQLLSTQVEQPNDFSSAGARKVLITRLITTVTVNGQDDFHVFESRSARRRRFKRQRQHTNEEMQLQLRQSSIAVTHQGPSQQMQHSANKPLIVGKRISFNHIDDDSSGVSAKPRLFGVRPIFNRPRKVIFCIL